MISLKTMVAGCMLAGGFGLACVPQARAGVGGEAAGWEPVPAEVCSALSVSKHYTLADADFGWVRDRINASLDRIPPDPSGNFRKAASHRIAADATQFGLRLDHARCEAVRDPLDGERLRAAGGPVAKDCRETGCEDPLPGWTAPEGATMVLWTCQGNVYREVEYVRVNGTWRVRSVREEYVAVCQASKDPGDGRDPSDGK